MSVKIMSRVWESECEASRLIVLLSLADFADDFGGSIFPSVARIAWKCGFSVRNVQRILSDLRAEGVLTIEGKTERGQNVYRLHASSLPLKPEFEGESKCSAGLRAQTIERFDMTCHWCGGAGDEINSGDGTAWHIDRINPGAKFGRYTVDNVVLSCGTCNRKKGGGAILAGGASGCIRGVHGDAPGGAIAMAAKPSGEPSGKEPSGKDIAPAKRARGAAKNDLLSAEMIAGFVLPPSIDNPEVKAALERWRQHRAGMRVPLSRNHFFTGLLKDCLEWGPDRIIAAVDHSIRKGWRGLFEPAAPVNGRGYGRPTAAERVEKDRKGTYGMDRQKFSDLQDKLFAQDMAEAEREMNADREAAQAKGEYES